MLAASVAAVGNIAEVTQRRKRRVFSTGSPSPRSQLMSIIDGLEAESSARTTLSEPRYFRRLKDCQPGISSNRRSIAQQNYGKTVWGSWMVPMITGALGMVTCLIANAAPCKRYPARSLCVDTTQGSFRKRADLRREKFPFRSRPDSKTGIGSKRSRTSSGTNRERTTGRSFFSRRRNGVPVLSGVQSRREDQHSRCRTNARRQSLRTAR